MSVKDKNARTTGGQHYQKAASTSTSMPYRRRFNYRYGTQKTRAATQAVARAARLLRARSSYTYRSGYGVMPRLTGRPRVEFKVVDTNPALTLIAAAGSLQLINGVATGNDYTDRIGRKIIMKTLLMRIFIYPTITLSSSQGTTTRCLVVYDTQPNGAAPAITDILTTNTYDSPMNLNNRDRFKVLYNKYVFTPSFVTSASVLTAGSPIPRIFQCYKKLNLDAIFGGTGSTIASIQTGSIYVLLQSNNDQTTSADPWYRIRFSDA